MNLSEAKKKVVGKRQATLIALMAFCLFLVPSFLRAEVMEDESGFYLGLGLAGTSFDTDLNSPTFNIKEAGGAAQLSVGYRFNPVFMIELAAIGSNHETSDTTIDAGISTIQLFGYYRFLSEKSFRPYFKGGLAGYALRLDYGSASAKMSGGGIAFGAGFRCFLSRRFSLGFDVTHNMISYDKEKVSIGQFSYEANTDVYGRLTTLGIIAGYSF
ncbi:MAG: porin family protein [Candidatus Zixiibacteriota bacterium]